MSHSRLDMIQALSDVKLDCQLKLEICKCCIEQLDAYHDWTGIDTHVEKLA